MRTFMREGQDNMLRCVERRRFREGPQLRPEVPILRLAGRIMHRMPDRRFALVKDKRVLFLAPVGVLVVLLSAGMVVVVMVVVVLTVVPSIDAVVDDRGLVEVQHRLKSATGDLNATPDPANARATGPAEVTGCAVDSLAVFEPSLSREWTFIGPAKGRDIRDTTILGHRAAVALATTLIEKGWLGDVELDQYAAVELAKSYNGYKIRMVIQADGESVLATGYTKYRRVCRS
jgi:hypothetical protein